jgi:hypothetical protein
VATLPHCCATHRLAAIEAIEALLANDAAGAVEKMVEEGWPRDTAIESVRSTYAEWILGRFRDAIEFGAGWAEVVE